MAKDKKRAEEKFKEINEAYEVLGDAEKRKKIRLNWEPIGNMAYAGTAPARNPADLTPTLGAAETRRKISNSAGTGFSDFFEQFFGGRAGQFDGFAGAEHEAGTEKGQDVEGVLMVTLEEAMRGAVRSISVRRNSVCPTCHGTGVNGRHACPDVRRLGRSAVTQNYKVKIPAGVRDGQRLRVSGQGEPGVGGGPARRPLFAGPFGQSSRFSRRGRRSLLRP